MPKIKQLSNGDVVFYCPGCKHLQRITKIWEFNGDFEQPTFSPSIKTWTNSYNRDGSIKGVDFVCHSFVTDGKIQFLSDCTHELKNQTVDLPDIEQYAIHGDAE